MNSSTLYELFRADTCDLRKPYLWGDDEVFRCMNEAYCMFVRLTGGIADFTSEATSAQIVSGESLASIHPSILRVMNAKRRSDNGEIRIINSPDLSKLVTSDYGHIKRLVSDTSSGPVNYMLLGAQRGTVRWIQSPVEDDWCDMMIFRLPLNTIDDAEQELCDVEEHHHYYLLHWMKHLAYLKNDADTLNPSASADASSLFRNYCAEVRGENSRYEHKHREVAYGGL